MNKYIFDTLNGGLEIENPQIIKHGFVGGEYKDGVSQGTFVVNIKLYKTGAYLFSYPLTGDTIPVDMSEEEIDIWVVNELIKHEVHE